MPTYKVVGGIICLLLVCSYIPYVASGDGDPVCDPGEYLLSHVCTPCQPGRYNSSGLGTSCLPCDIGTYQPDPGSRSCHQCEPGTFADVMESLSCTPCPDNMTSSAGASECFRPASGKRSTLSSETMFTTPQGQSDEPSLLETTSDTTTTTDTDTSPSEPYTLSKIEIAKISAITQKIILLIEINEKPDTFYATTKDLLTKRLSMYTERKEMKKVAMITHLMKILEEHFESTAR